MFLLRIFCCGGVVVDKISRTSLKGLYACGEVSMTGVHGANRLASNSLLEGVVFAERASINIKEFINKFSALSRKYLTADNSGLT